MGALYLLAYGVAQFLSWLQIDAIFHSELQLHPSVLRKVLPSETEPDAPQNSDSQETSAARRKHNLLSLSCHKCAECMETTLVSGSTLTFLDSAFGPVGNCTMNLRKGVPSCSGHNAATYVHKCVPATRVLSKLGLDWIDVAINVRLCNVDSPLQREQWALAELQRLCHRDKSFCDVAPELISEYQGDFRNLTSNGVVIRYGGHVATKENLPANALRQVYRLAAALRAASIAHNDIKNTELLVDASGTLRLIDFAYATRTHSELRQQQHDGCLNRLQLMLDDLSALLTAVRDIELGLQSVALSLNMWQAYDRDPIHAPYMVRRRPDEFHCAIVNFVPEPNTASISAKLTEVVTREANKRPWKYKIEHQTSAALAAFCKAINSSWTYMGIHQLPIDLQEWCEYAADAERVDVIVLRSIAPYYVPAIEPGMPGVNCNMCTQHVTSSILC
eukprot:SAG31_NODE_4642_length_3076_cov_76.513268_3_plen_447_part_00